MTDLTTITDQPVKIRYPKPANFAPVTTWPEDNPFFGTKTRRCLAWNPNYNRQCLGIARTGKRVCRAHGGNNLSGIASKTWKDGRHSKYLPKGLAEKYQETYADKDLHNLDAELRVVDARMGELFQRVTDEGGSLWVKARDAYQSLVLATKIGNRADINTAMVSMNNYLTQGASEYAAWSELHALIDLRRKLVESITKRQIHLQLFMSYTDVWNFFMAISNVVKANVTDQRVLAALQEAFTAIISRNNVDVVDASFSE
jgi:hypothetical protein